MYLRMFVCIFIFLKANKTVEWLQLSILSVSIAMEYILILLIVIHIPAG